MPESLPRWFCLIQTKKSAHISTSCVFRLCSLISGNQYKHLIGWDTESAEGVQPTTGHGRSWAEVSLRLLSGAGSTG